MYRYISHVSQNIHKHVNHSVDFSGHILFDMYDISHVEFLIL